MARYVTGCISNSAVSFSSCCLHRDCLAAPGTTVADTGAPVGNPNKNKTCYKCQQEGHVSSPLSDTCSSLTFSGTMQIARDCPENADYAA